MTARVSTDADEIDPQAAPSIQEIIRRCFLTHGFEQHISSASASPIFVRRKRSA
ncbi:hypothetical protein [Nocardia sp. NPDC051463]|uniref:hypothetical protein n=1 Tax=Nocardia sp. NPDC051463 TaxID=3154845 RepID=UPI003449E6B1